MVLPQLLPGLSLSAILISGNALHFANMTATGAGFIGSGPQTPAIPLDLNNGANAASVSTPASQAVARLTAADAQTVVLNMDSFAQNNVILARRADGTAASRTGLVKQRSYLPHHGLGVDKCRGIFGGSRGCWRGGDRDLEWFGKWRRGYFTDN